jgi:signal transduction histidine kinase
MLSQVPTLEMNEQLTRVTHDLNDLLTAIIGYTDLSLRRIEIGDPIHHNLEETKRAAERAVTLLRQFRAANRISNSSGSHLA